MFSTIIDAVLLAALVVTTVSMVSVHRRLRRLDGAHREMERVFGEVTRSIERAETALDSLARDGCATAVTLGLRIEEARRVLARLEATRAPLERTGG